MFTNQYRQLLWLMLPTVSLTPILTAQVHAIEGELEPIEPKPSLTSVDQLRDVTPSDWAYTALQSLVERYGCIAGYPDGTFQGDRPLGRFELVAALNSCLDALGSQSVSAEDLETLKAIQEEMMSTLSTTRQTLDRLEGRVATLETQQFSTTTKLNGEAILSAQFGDFVDTFGLSNNFQNNPFQADILPTPEVGPGRGTPAIINQISGEPRGTAIARVRLGFNTSFTGNDNLNTVLETGNGGRDFLTDLGFSGPSNPFPVPPIVAQGRPKMVDLGAVDYANVGPDVNLYRLAYQFSPAKDLSLTLGTNVYPSDFIDFNSYANDEGKDFSSGFFINNPLIIANNIDAPGGAGGAIDWSISDNLSLRALYVAASPAVSVGGDNGLFNAPYQISTELEYQDEFGSRDQNNFAVRIQGTRVTTQNAATVQNVLGLNAEATFGKFGVFGRYGLSLDPKFGGGFGGTDLFAGVPGVGANSNIQTWMAGLGLNDLGREGALLAVAVGQPFLVNSSQANYSPQTNFEAFYRLPLGDNISFTPTVQYVLNPFNIEPAAGQPDNSLVQLLLRTTFYF